MIRTGQTLVNAVTGESLTFVRTAADTNGELVEVECVVQPGGFVAAAHVHPHQSERFAVVEGELSSRRARSSSRSRPARRPSSSPARRTSSGTTATRRSASAARSARRSPSSR